LDIRLAVASRRIASHVIIHYFPTTKIDKNTNNETNNKATPGTAQQATTLIHFTSIQTLLPLGNACVDSHHDMIHNY
jgi:hypothetical protein